MILYSRYMSEVRFRKISTRIIVKTVFFHLSSFSEFIKSCWHTLCIYDYADSHYNHQLT